MWQVIDIELWDIRNIFISNNWLKQRLLHLTLTGRKSCIWQRLSMRMRMCRAWMRWRRRMKKRSSCIWYVSTGTRWRELFSHSRSSITKPHLNTSFWQLSSLSEFLSGVYVRILRSLERSFQFVQLSSCERRSAPALLSFQLNSWLALAIRSGTRFSLKWKSTQKKYYTRHSEDKKLTQKPESKTWLQ